MFYEGIVEDIHDPEKLGRVKVRIWGLHTDSKKGGKEDKLSTEDLPWAMPIFPSNFATISEEGMFGVPEQGSIVAIIFKDPYEQHPYYMGTIPHHFKESPDYTKGFSDPDKVYPRGKTKGEPSTSRIARNEKINDTIMELKKQTLTKPKLFQEPITPYNAKYPDNNVIQTKSGNLIEIDDTEDSERIHIYHRSGTNEEYYPKGEKVEKVKGNKVTIVLENYNVKVEGDNLVEIDGTWYQKVDKSATIEAKNIDLDCGTPKSGVVTGNSICPILGIPHVHFSSTVKASE